MGTNTSEGLTPSGNEGEALFYEALHFLDIQDQEQTEEDKRLLLWFWGEEYKTYIESVTSQVLKGLPLGSC